MLHCSNVLVIEADGSPIELIERLYLTLKTPMIDEAVCVIHKTDIDGNSLPDWKKRTIDKIYNDNGRLIIKLI